MTLDRGGNMQASTELLLAANGDITPTNHNGTNGSIITMTLKNNHLIVETEERNVSGCWQLTPFSWKFMNQF
jgi:hypothetical protein